MSRLNKYAEDCLEYLFDCFENGEFEKDVYIAAHKLITKDASSYNQAIEPDEYVDNAVELCGG